MATVIDRWKVEPDRYGHGKRYQVRYRDDLKNWRRKAFTNKADATRYATSVQHQLDSGLFRDPKSGTVPFAMYANAWFASRVDLSPSTNNSYRGCLDNHILPAIGSIELSRLRAEHGRTFIAGFAGERGATARKAAMLVSSILKSAVLDFSFKHLETLLSPTALDTCLQFPYFNFFTFCSFSRTSELFAHRNQSRQHSFFPS